MSESSTDSMLESTADPAPAIDLCWIPEGVAASELSDVAMAWTPVHSSGSDDLSDLSWQSIGSGSSQVDCEDGIGVRVTSINENQRYAFRMRANHDGVWLISNDAEAMLVDSSKPLRTVVTAGASGLSGDTAVPDLICRDYDDPATREDEAGSFLLSIGFTTASAEYLRYEPVNDFDPASDLTLVNATAELLDRPYDTRLGYRVRITPERVGRTRGGQRSGRCRDPWGDVRGQPGFRPSSGAKPLTRWTATRLSRSRRAGRKSRGRGNRSKMATATASGPPANRSA